MGRLPYNPTLDSLRYDPRRPQQGESIPSLLFAESKRATKLTYRGQCIPRWHFIMLVCLGVIIQAQKKRLHRSQWGVACSSTSEGKSSARKDMIKSRGFIKCFHTYCVRPLVLTAFSLQLSGFIRKMRLLFSAWPIIPSIRGGKWKCPCCLNLQLFPL